MRKDVINAVNRLAAGCKSLDLDLMKMYRLIFNYMTENKKLISKIKLELINGVLIADGNVLERVAPLIRPFNIGMPRADFYENRILARAGL